MWAAIRRNTRRSHGIIGLMAALLLGLGALLGYVLLGAGGAFWGLLAAAAIWAALLAITLLGGEDLLLLTAGAREIRKEDAPRLWNVVEEMSIAAGLPAMPRVYLVDSYLQNAFAVGRTPERARIVITDGLIRRLSRDELQGVVAHEIGHIRNLDVRFMTIASVMVGGIALLADASRRTLWFGGRRGRVQGPAHLYIPLLGGLLVASALAPLLARMLYLACSRQREYLADASAARFTRYPEGLASALEKIAERRGVAAGDTLAALSPMFIVNPAVERESAGAWLRTHPPTEERVRILRAMGGAGWVDYERAYRKVTGRGRCLDDAVVRAEPSLPARAAAGPEPDVETVARVREALGVFDRAADILTIPCACGVRVKVPPEYRASTVHCPRCGADHPVAQAAPAPAGTEGDAALSYRRRSPGWDSFRCACGRLLHLSPALRVERMRCRDCGRQIRIG